MKDQTEKQFISFLRSVNRLRDEGSWNDRELEDKETILRHYFQVQYRLLVYGTLAPGEPNEHLLRTIGGSWKKHVFVRGYHYPEGWGKTEGFPAFRWDPDVGRVPVQLFTSHWLPEHWSRLDAFEGSGYRRIVVPVYDPGGFYTVANIYEALP